MSDLEAHLQAQESEIARDREISRVLACHEKDYFAILQINPLVEQTGFGAMLRRIYRKKSLQIHPDKVKNANAPRAFDLLKKANLVLSAESPGTNTTAVTQTGSKEDEGDEDGQEEKSRFSEKENLILIYKQVADGIGAAIVKDFDHPSNSAIREKVRLVLENYEKDKEVEKEFQQRQELKKQSEIKTAAKERELKRSWESRWELDRDTRVKLWRSFTSKVDKPKKKKKVLI